MKSILLIIIGFIVGIVVTWQITTYVERYEKWQKAKFDPVLVEFAGCGDDSLQGWK